LFGQRRQNGDDRVLEYSTAIEELLGVALVADPIRVEPVEILKRLEHALTTETIERPDITLANHLKKFLAPPFDALRVENPAYSVRLDQPLQSCLPYKEREFPQVFAVQPKQIESV
jgi:hypothetical protein